jgi:hypothetical protein
MSSLSNTEGVVEGDYEHFMKSTTGHVVLIVTFILAVLYIRLLSVSFCPNFYKWILWLCCCTEEEEEDEEETLQMDASATSQTPMGPSDGASSHDIEFGTQSKKATEYMQQPQNYRDDIHQYTDGCGDYHNEEGAGEYHGEIDDRNTNQQQEYPPNEEYYDDQYNIENTQHSQPYPDNQYYEDNSTGNYGEYYEPQEPQPPPIHHQQPAQQQSLPQPQRNHLTPVSSRRHQAPQQPTRGVEDVESYNPARSQRRARIHPSRIN